MSYFTNAYTDDSPYWACYYNYTLHPLYHQCDKCPDRYRCDKAILPPLPEEKAANPNCNHQCRRCSEAWGCKKLQEHLYLLAVLEDVVVTDNMDKSFWEITHGCPHDERCVSCADIVHCYPLRLWRKLSPR